LGYYNDKLGNAEYMYNIPSFFTINNNTNQILFAMEENYKISSEYLKDLQKCLKQGVKGVTRYKIAQASYERSNAHLIIKKLNKIDLTIKYLDGTEQKFPTYNELMRMTKNLNDLYPKNRKAHINRYFKIINAFTKHRAERKRRKAKSNTLTPEQIKLLASQI